MAAAPPPGRKASATSIRPAAPRTARRRRPARTSTARPATSRAPFFGRDLNGDGDILDTIRILAPSQTQTNRYGLIAGLRYDFNDLHSFRVNYSFDRGRHRQTGEVGFLQINGEPFDVFLVNDPLADVGGNVLQKRDRRSIALLHQFSAEYRGEFFDSRLSVNAGVRVPWFERDLNNFCATSSASGFVECFGTNTAGLAAWLARNPTVNIGGGRRRRCRARSGASSTITRSC